ncbi:drug/metabolite transporter (DMT)-like permease [Deinobacterium chartae]|uniref:Drug/metabolite transporter (DMT)-like permease n=1 Tax=Deinobacterium chartae TaxID=521158 RepID=A0A841I272_9DEIO|nr:multidrug resistance efflux transporter family protein [Deinobacterium chartae]MBB6099373.1 drug/metabolite transporter (DMT)-like permease [Deinobacterium chartae]
MKTPASAVPLLLGLLAALFFSATLLLNRKMGLEGGDWGWMSSLRFVIMLPLLAVPVLLRREGAGLLRELRACPGVWLLWSTVGFGLFYAPFTLANTLMPAWLMGGTWQITILMGLLLSPLLYRDARRIIPRPALLISGVVVAGVVLTQIEHARSLHSPADLILGLLLTLVAAVAYPLGNRKIMLHLEERGLSLSVYQRVLGMTLASMPFWLLVAATAGARSGTPSGAEVLQSGLIALSSGVIATLLFFRATDLARSNATALASVEATQAAEVVFALLGEVLLLSAAWPGPLASLGLAVVVVGIVAYSTLLRPPAGSAPQPAPDPRPHREQEAVP